MKPALIIPIFSGTVIYVARQVWKHQPVFSTSERSQRPRSIVTGVDALTENATMLKVWYISRTLDVFHLSYPVSPESFRHSLNIPRIDVTFEVSNEDRSRDFSAPHL